MNENELRKRYFKIKKIAEDLRARRAAKIRHLTSEKLDELRINRLIEL